MSNNVDYLTSSLKDSGILPQSVVAATDEIAEDLIKQVMSEETQGDGTFVEGVQALQAAIAAALGVGTKG